LVAFINASVVIIILIFLLAYAISAAQEGVVAAVKARVSEVKRWGGWILIIIGAWFILLAIFAGFFARVFPV
jgi:hypothetical protein